MRFFIVALAALFCTGAGNDAADLERLKRELKVAAPPAHYPDHADYLLLPKICNAKICFLALAVRIVSADGHAVRLAIFSENEHYIGSYAGLTMMPTGVVGATLYFPATSKINRVRFDRTSPPAEIQIDDRAYAFQRAR